MRTCSHVDIYPPHPLAITHPLSYDQLTPTGAATLLGYDQPSSTLTQAHTTAHPIQHHTEAHSLCCCTHALQGVNTSLLTKCDPLLLLPVLPHSLLPVAPTFLAMSDTRCPQNTIMSPQPPGPSPSPSPSPGPPTSPSPTPSPTPSSPNPSPSPRVSIAHQHATAAVARLEHSCMEPLLATPFLLPPRE